MDGNIPVELRGVRGILYGEINFSTLLSDYGQDPADAASTMSGLEQANASLPGLSALARGNWVSVNLPELNSVLTKELRVPSSQQKQLARFSAELKHLMAQIGPTFKQNATFTNSGDHQGRTEYTVHLASQSFVDRLVGLAQQALTAALPTTPGDQIHLPTTITSIPPTQRTVFQVWVKDNRVEELDLDLRQFDPKEIPVPLPLRLVISAGVAVPVPTGVTPLNVAGFARRFVANLQHGGQLPGLGAPTTSS